MSSPAGTTIGSTDSTRTLHSNDPTTVGVCVDAGSTVDSVVVHLEHEGCRHRCLPGLNRDRVEHNPRSSVVVD